MSRQESPRKKCRDSFTQSTIPTSRRRHEERGRRKGIKGKRKKKKKGTTPKRKKTGKKILQKDFELGPKKKKKNKN